jgi:hypothetical protein
MEIAHAGTCSPLHFKRMEFEKFGVLPVDNDKLRRSFPTAREQLDHSVTHEIQDQLLAAQ